MLCSLLLAIATYNALPKDHLSHFLSDKDFCAKQLTQASGIVVVFSSTEAVSAFTDSLQGSILPRTIVRATQAFLLGNNWFGCGCGYWWRWGCSRCGSDHGGC